MTGTHARVCEGFEALPSSLLLACLSGIIIILVVAVVVVVVVVVGRMGRNDMCEAWINPTDRKSTAGRSCNAAAAVDDNNDKLYGIAVTPCGDWVVSGNNEILGQQCMPMTF